MKALLFDFDGVLFKSMESHYEGWRRALKSYGIDMVPEELYMLEGQGIDTIANQLTRKFNLPIEEAPYLIEKKQNYYKKMDNHFYPNLIDVLNWAVEKLLKMAVVTGGKRYNVLSSLNQYGLTSYFQAIVTSDDLEETKPSPLPFLIAANLLECDPKDCIVIENAPLGIRSGKTAEMKVVAIASTLNPLYLKEADVVVSDLLELHQALRKLY